MLQIETYNVELSNFEKVKGKINNFVKKVLKFDRK